MSHRTRFHAQFGPPEAVVLEGPRLRVSAPLRNRSDRAWAAGGAVRLAYQVLDPETNAMLEDGPRAELPALDPGGEARATLDVKLPSEDGAYRVLVSPVEENIAWFFERGGDCLLVDAELSGGRLAIRSARRITALTRARERWQRRLARAFFYPFAALWRNRGLISSMVRRDIHGRYRGSVAGMFWTVIHPLLMMLTYFFIFSVVLKVRFPAAAGGPEQAGGVNFLLYFIAGMLPWLAFSEALGRSPGVVLEHRTLVTRVVFPVEILPANLAASGLVSEFFGLVVFLAAVGVFRHTIPATAALLPVVLVPQVLLTIGLCWFLAGLGVFLRDTGQFMAFLLTLWFFVTPICYPETALPESLRWLFELNPVYVMVRCYRAIFLEGAAPPWGVLARLAAFSLAVFIGGFAWFYKSRKAFADVL